MSSAIHQHDPQHGSAAAYQLAQQVKAESIQLVYTQSRTVLVVSLLNAGFLVYLLWGVIPQQTLLIWLGLLLTLTLARGVSTVRYFRDPMRDSHTDRWARRYVIGALLSGILWGTTGIFLYAPGQIEYQALLYFLLGGMGAGAFASHVSYLPAFRAYFIPTLLPIILQSMLQSDPVHITMTAWGIIYFLALLRLARNSNHLHNEAIRLRLVNQGLLGEVKEQHRQAEHANQSKSHFLAAASHDLRQPLYALGLFTQRLYRATDIEDTRHTASLIERSFNSLKNLLDSLLDISRLDAGVIQVNRRHFALQELFDLIATDYRPMAQEKGITLHLVPTSAWLYSDPRLVERILRNLVLNAIRYTQRGKVLVGVRRHASHYSLQVLDSGIGIPLHEQENIFQEFHQLNNPERDREKGLGLGLSIVQRLATLLGNRIALQSQPGHGSRFTLDLPAGMHTAHAKVAHPRGEMANGTRVLVIDDDSFILLATQSFLTPLGYQVLTAEGCDEALQLLQQGEAPPEVIISDYRLRDKRTGVEAANAIRQWLQREVPVIIITGDTDPELIREAAAHNFHLLHKPATPQLLHSAINTTLSQAVAAFA